MTKRKVLVRQIARAAAAQGLAFMILREGGSHTVYVLDGKRIPNPRHVDIGEILARKIREQAAERLGKDWWR